MTTDNSNTAQGAVDNYPRTVNAQTTTSVDPAVHDKFERDLRDKYPFDNSRFPRGDYILCYDGIKPRGFNQNRPERCEEVGDTHVMRMCRALIRTKLTRTRKINKFYVPKHFPEKLLRVYVSAGEMIAAFIMEGYHYKFDEAATYFNVSKLSVRAVELKYGLLYGGIHRYEYYSGAPEFLTNPDALYPEYRTNQDMYERVLRTRHYLNILCPL